jgi:hypothetical protein
MYPAILNPCNIIGLYEWVTFRKNLKGGCSIFQKFIIDKSISSIVFNIFRKRPLA